jgi:hypothetical protein
MPTARTPAQLRADAWQAFTTADRPVTPEWLADAANLTNGGALRLLTDWRAEGRAVPVAVTPPPSPYDTPWAVLGGAGTGDKRPKLSRERHSQPDHTVDDQEQTREQTDPYPSATAHGRGSGHRHTPDHGIDQGQPAALGSGTGQGPQPSIGEGQTNNDSHSQPNHRANVHGTPRPTTDRRILATPNPAPPAPTPTRTRRAGRPAPDVVLAAALDYAAKGRAVFLLGRTKRPVANCRPCTMAGPDHDPQACDCLTCHGFYAATTDPDRIAAIVATVRGGLLAVRTGAISDLLVMDIDPRNGGCLVPDLMPPTEAVATGGGGWHLLYTHPGGYIPSRKLPGHPGVDVKADGGYVVAPPSVHPGTGRPYRPVGDRHLIEMHPALRDLVTGDVAPSPPSHTPTGTHPTRATTLARAGCISNPDALLTAHLATLARAPEGSRRRTLYGVSRGVARMVAAGAIGPGDAVAVLTAAGANAGQSARQTHNAITAAFAAEGVALPTQEAA